MRNGKSILVVVPARGGSKGVPLKNLRKLGGVPLVGLVGRVVAQLDFVDRAVVSTDHEAIAQAAEAEGLSAPFRRSEALAGDRIGDWDVLHEALIEMERIDDRQYDIVLMLQPTSVFRTPKQVTATLDTLLEGNFDSVWSLSETDSKSHPLKQLTVTSTRDRAYFDPAGSSIIARQQLSPVYHRNGVAYALTRECLLDHRSIEGRRPGALIIDEPVANIDTEDDFALAEFWMMRLDMDWIGNPTADFPA